MSSKFHEFRNINFFIVFILGDANCYNFLSSAPPVPSSLSWLLAEIESGKVPGNPPLTGNGNLARVDGGLEFDGVSAFLAGTLDSKQCLVDPDICSEGFSFGLKVKFMTNSLTVNTPRYVVDSGRTAKGRGIAVYIVMKELFIEIASSNTLYKVRKI